jgi:hypothetical protein
MSEMTKHAKGAISKHEKKPKHGMKRTIHEHHNNGSHTTHHEMHPMDDGTPREPISYASPDDASMLQAMGQHLGAGEPDGGEGAAPAAEAAPAA